MSDGNGSRKSPNNGRYPPGQSGNLKGRPRKLTRHHEQLSMLAEITIESLYEEVIVIVDGKRIKMPYWKALMQSVKRDALRGSAKARDQLISLAALESPAAEPLRITIIGGLPDN